MDGFIIIGNGGAITYKEVFPLIKEGKMGLGYKPFGGEMYFQITDEYKEEIVNTKKEGTGWVEIDGEVMAMVRQACWFSSFPAEKRPLVLTKSYSPDKYPKYDNYDAIEVSRVKDIPYDYDGVMGVPISFLGNYNPNQFEIVGLGIANLGLECGVRPYLPEHKAYRKNVQKRGTVDGDLYMVDSEGHPVVPYARILIRKKKEERE